VGGGHAGREGGSVGGGHAGREGSSVGGGHAGREGSRPRDGSVVGSHNGSVGGEVIEGWRCGLGQTIRASNRETVKYTRRYSKKEIPSLPASSARDSAA